ncbi:MAG: diaminopimelate epimerase [Thermomicrobiales bacterium]
MDRPVPFHKMHGSGNDFVLVDQSVRTIPRASEAAWVRAVCQRRVGIGADGVVFIEPVDPSLPGAAEADFRWRYVNADGSDAGMCGNGAMCGARFAVSQGIAPAACCFQTDAGLIHAEVDPAGPGVRLAMVDSCGYVPPRSLETSAGCLEIASITVGVPHAVIAVDDADRWPSERSFQDLGQEIRHHPSFAPQGTNVNAISPCGGNGVRMRTYERGVEGETLACGTGAVASAIVASRLGLVDASRPVRVMSSGGWPLDVTFTWDDATARACSIILAGNAVLVARGELEM